MPHGALVLPGGCGIIILIEILIEQEKRQMNDTGRQAIALDDIEEHETACWLGEQFDRSEHLVREHGGDDEMLEAIRYLRDENE